MVELDTSLGTNTPPAFIGLDMDFYVGLTAVLFGSATPAKITFIYE